MKKKKYLIIFLLLFVCFIANVNAENLLDDNELEEVVAQTTKYYKTVTVLNDSSLMRAANQSEVHSITTEISEEEYNSISPDNNISPQSVSIETTYKRLTATISKYNSYYYKYKGDLTWKLMPSTRSYDVIGLGYFASVKLSGEIDFEQSYCTVNGVCDTINSGYYNYKGVNGSGVVFPLPDMPLASLTQSIYILVEKTNSSTTVVEQELDADYAHAQKSISYSMAKDIYIDTCGIQPANYTYYDSMNEATVKWTGTW